MPQKWLPMRKVRKTLESHLDEGRSARAIAAHCGLARRSVGQKLERFAASPNYVTSSVTQRVAVLRISRLACSVTTGWQKNGMAK